MTLSPQSWTGLLFVIQSNNHLFDAFSAPSLGERLSRMLGSCSWCSLCLHGPLAVEDSWGWTLMCCSLRFLWTRSLEAHARGEGARPGLEACGEV